MKDKIISGKHKPFIVANVREILEQYDNEDISYSRMVEKFNEVAENYYSKKILVTTEALSDIKNWDAELSLKWGNRSNRATDALAILEM